MDRMNRMNSMNQMEGQYSTSTIAEHIALLMEGEPDFVEVKSKDYHVVVWRVPTYLMLNGYVGVRRNHPYYGLGANNRRIRNIRVHGGITFAGKREITGFKKEYWYFGFDSGHSQDILPGIESEMLSMMDLFVTAAFGERATDLKDDFMTHYQSRPRTYKDVTYISRETEKLYEFLRQVKERQPHYQYSPVREYRKLAQLKRRNQIETI